MTSRTKSWINIILLAITLIVNYMGASGLINHLSQKEVSDMYPTLITPAPFAFSIWVVIYTLLIISLIVLIIKNKDYYYEKITEEISPLFWLSCVFNIAWIISFSYNLIGLSVVFIFALLLSLVRIVEKIGKMQREKHWLFPLTFGLYSGWLFIATVVNISAWLVKIEWGGWGISPQIWSTIILLVAIVLIFMVLSKIKNAVFPLPIAWAYWGIYNSLLAAGKAQGVYILLSNIALAGIIILVGLSIWQFYKNNYQIMPIL